MNIRKRTFTFNAYMLYIVNTSSGISVNVTDYHKYTFYQNPFLFPNKRQSIYFHVYLFFSSFHNVNILPFSFNCWFRDWIWFMVSQILAHLNLYATCLGLILENLHKADGLKVFSETVVAQLLGITSCTPAALVQQSPDLLSHKPRVETVTSVCIMS